MYKKVKRYFFDKNNSTTSIENAENVVKEPNRPIIKKYFIKSSDKFLTKLSETKYPIKNEPNKLTDKVE